MSESDSEEDVALLVDLREDIVSSVASSVGRSATAEPHRDRGVSPENDTGQISGQHEEVQLKGTSRPPTATSRVTDEGLLEEYVSA